MKLRHVVTNAVRAPETTILRELGKRKSKSVPTPAEICWRTFGLHIERGGIHGRDLEDWLRGRMLTPRRVQRHGKRKNKKVRCVVGTMSKFVRGGPAMKSLGIAGDL